MGRPTFWIWARSSGKGIFEVLAPRIQVSFGELLEIHLRTNSRAIRTGIWLPTNDGGQVFISPVHLQPRSTVRADMTKYDLQTGG